MEERYQLIEPLGTGGMASVHKAEDRVLGRQVAIKRLLPHFAADPVAAERFRREAQAAASLNHPGIVTIYDTGEDEAGPFIVMELLEGDTVAARLAEQGPLGVARTVAVVQSVAEALDHAHAHGVVHRDIKPSNLIVDDNGEVRITDFGIAQAMEDPTLVTSTGEVVGTLAYIAPEILEGAAATPASDVYSLGAVAYEMLAGRPPFQADNIGALLTRIREEPPPPMGNAVPVEIATVVLRALDKDPEQRPAWAGALATSLMAGTTLPLQADIAPTAPIPTPVPSASESLAAPGTAGPEAEEPTRVLATEKRGPSAKVPLLLLVALALVLAILLLAPGGDDTEAAGPTLATTTTTTTTTAPTTTTTAPTTTTLDPDSPEAITATILEILDELEPPEFKPKEVEDIEDQLQEILERAAEDDREDLGESLEKAFEEVADLPDSPERDALFDQFVRLAEAYGFTVTEVEDDDGGGRPGRGRGDD